MRSPLATLPSPELLRRLHRLVHRGRLTEADLLAHLGELDARRLYLEEACPSMFAYCVRVLRFAEDVAYKRIQVARGARRHPQLLEAVRRGDLHMTAASLLAPQLTEENVAELIQAAKRKTKEQVRTLLADRRPQPDVPASIQRLPASPPVKGPVPPDSPPPSPMPERRPAPASPGPAPRPEPLGGERYRVCFMADRETHAQLEELRALLRHQVPDGDLGKILAHAIAHLLAQVRRRKFAETTEPQAPKTPAPHSSRAIPAATRREVARRDGERCTYVSASGRRCGSREFLEFHHLDPWQRSRAHPVAGITFRCRAHNGYQAERDFGAHQMARFRRGTRDHPGELDPDPVREMAAIPMRARDGAS